MRCELCIAVRSIYQISFNFPSILSISRQYPGQRTLLFLLLQRSPCLGHSGPGVFNEAAEICRGMIILLLSRALEKIIFLTSCHLPGPPWSSCHFLTPGLFTFNAGPVSSELPDLHHVTPKPSLTAVFFFSHSLTRTESVRPE